ncbi:MAG: hypothetical protein J2P19_21915 [Pseudonocardia sp.]|nr:hypothetical protein [Pseudonocardia sp.]
MRRTLRTRTALLTFRQRNRLEAVFAADERAPVEVTWAVYHVVGVRRRCVGTDVGRRRDRSPLAPNTVPTVRAVESR